MDALSETLRVVQLVGAIFINARFTAPWCYKSPSAAAAAPILEPGAERVVIFHLVTEGECYVEMSEQPPVRLIAGDVVVFPAGDTHVMTSQPGLPPAKGARLDAVLARRPRQLSYGGGGATTRLVCGYLACDARLARILLAGLPPLVKVNVRGSNAGVWLEASVRYLAASLGPKGIRVNGISAGPIKTLAAAGISGFGKILKFVEEQSPMRRNVSTEDVGNAAAFLLSDLAAGITGEILYVDSGFSHVVAGLGGEATSSPG